MEDRLPIERISIALFLALTACGGPDEDQDEFEFGKADMEASFHGIWVGTWTPQDGAPSPFQLSIRSPDEPALRGACGSRALGDGAEPSLSPLCLTMTTLGVSATVTIEDGTTDPIDLDGFAETGGSKLTNASIELSREGAPFSLFASWNDESGFTECSAFGEGGAAFATCTLERE
jgi:hypothetical protein